MKQRLEQDYYRSVHSLVSDIHLIYLNAAEYNHPGASIVRLAFVLSSSLSTYALAGNQNNDDPSPPSPP